MSTTDLPLLNACLNGTASIFLILGFIFIIKKNKKAHQFCMTSAFVISALFLVSYLTYHSLHGSVKFTAQGWIRPVYFFILITHIILAMINLPMVLRTFYLATQERFEEHQKLARWTWPIWMYVSVTGVLVYLMLYQWFPPTVH